MRCCSIRHFSFEDEIRRTSSFGLVMLQSERKRIDKSALFLNGDYNEQPGRREKIFESSQKMFELIPVIEGELCQCSSDRFKTIEGTISAMVRLATVPCSKTLGKSMMKPRSSHRMVEDVGKTRSTKPQRSRVRVSDCPGEKIVADFRRTEQKRSV